MSKFNVALYDFNHYFNLATEIECPSLDTPLHDCDFGHGRLVRFSDVKGNRTLALTIKGKSIAIVADAELFQLFLHRPTQPNSSFRLFSGKGDSFYHGAMLKDNDVTNIMKQITNYI